MRKREWELNKEIDGIRMTNTFMGPKTQRLLKKKTSSITSISVERHAGIIPVWAFEHKGNVWSVLSQCHTRLRLPHLLYGIEIMKHAFSMFFTLIKHGFLISQSAPRDLSIL